jgi:beta-lactamase regulating signal transducer with metallopeptidase domain
VNGVFSNAANATALAASAASASAAAASAAAAAPFVLPGTKILIFPIGAIVTGVWAFLGMATLAYGTVGRMRFRDQYRGRVMRAQKSEFGTI